MSVSQSRTQAETKPLNLHTCSKGPLLLRSKKRSCEQCASAAHLTKIFFGPRTCEGNQPHLYDGPVITENAGLWSSRTCSRCGRLAITDTVWE